MSVSVRDPKEQRGIITSPGYTTDEVEDEAVAGRYGWAIDVYEVAKRAFQAEAEETSRDIYQLIEPLDRIPVEEAAIGMPDGPIGMLALNTVDFESFEDDTETQDWIKTGLMTQGEAYIMAENYDEERIPNTVELEGKPAFRISQDTLEFELERMIREVEDDVIDLDVPRQFSWKGALKDVDKGSVEIQHRSHTPI